jgi:hypothetical protein
MLQKTGVKPNKFTKSNIDIYQLIVVAGVPFYGTLHSRKHSATPVHFGDRAETENEYVSVRAGSVADVNAN